MGGRSGDMRRGEMSAAFREVATRLSGELVTQLSQEHTREAAVVYQEILNLRQELERAAELMQGYLAREKQMHDMMEQLTSTYAQATAQLHAAHSQFSEHAGRVTDHHSVQRQQLVDPMVDTENELARIRAILATPPAVPTGVTAASLQSMPPSSSQGVGMRSMSQIPISVQHMRRNV